MASATFLRTLAYKTARAAEVNVEGTGTAEGIAVEVAVVEAVEEIRVAVRLYKKNAVPLRGFFKSLPVWLFN